MFLGEFAPERGWTFQQFLKLMVSRVIDSPFYLSIDSDHLLTRPLRAADLVVGGRSMVTPESRSVHPEWWDGTANILGVPPIGETGIAISCVCMATQVVRRLLNHLDEWVGTAWRELLLERYDWVDYALYYSYANGLGLAESLHFPGPLLGTGESVWHPSQVASWDAKRAFSGTHRFVCLQSNTDIAPDEIRAKTEPYLGSWDRI
jgi:hypothetical protein